MREGHAAAVLCADELSTVGDAESQVASQFVAHAWQAIGKLYQMVC